LQNGWSGFAHIKVPESVWVQAVSMIWDVARKHETYQTFGSARTHDDGVCKVEAADGGIE